LYRTAYVYRALCAPVWTAQRCDDWVHAALLEPLLCSVLFAVLLLTAYILRGRYAYAEDDWS
jgi:hypothetical protein